MENTIENKKKIKIEIKRENGKTFLSFDVDASLEAIFKKQAQEIRESINWKGLKFYYVPEIIDSVGYRDLLYGFNLVDDYGTCLYSGTGTKKFNIAFLRTVGGKGTILLKNDIPFAVVSDGVRRIISFTKKYYEEFLKDYKVRGFLTFEV